jgi:cytochrome P450
MRFGTSDNKVSRRAPGPPLRSLLTYGAELLQQDPVDVAVDLREQYGHVVRIPPIYPGLNQPAYLVAHPDDVQYVLQSHPDAFGDLNIPGSADFADVLDGSLLDAPLDGDSEWWIERLRQVAPEFSEHAAVERAPTLAQTTSTTVAEYTMGEGETVPSTPLSMPERSTLGRMLGDRSDPALVRTDTPGVVRLLPLMSRLSVRLLGASLFGPDIRAHETAVIRSVARLRRAFKRRTFSIVTGGVSRRLPDWISSPLSAPLQLVNSGQSFDQRDPLETLHKAAGAMAARRVRTPQVFDDAVTTWLTRPDPVTGETLTPESARREIAGLLVAGFPTISAALTWAVYLSATHPKIQERIRKEARASRLFALPEDANHADWAPDRAALFSELSFTHRVWRESLRLYPTVPIFGRTASESVELSGYSIEAGAPVFVSPYVTHRDPAFWDNPTTFDPDRFLPDRHHGRHEFAYYPFSAGPHGCLGQQLATTEAVVALATLFSEYNVELADEDGDAGVDSAINLQPDRDLHVHLKPTGVDEDAHLDTS